MGQIALSLVAQAQETFVSRNVELAQELARQDAEIDRLNREIPRRAVAIGDDLDLREWAIFMTLVARALERSRGQRRRHRRTDRVCRHRAVPGARRRLRRGSAGALIAVGSADVRAVSVDAPADRRHSIDRTRLTVSSHSSPTVSAPARNAF